MRFVKLKMRLLSSLFSVNLFFLSYCSAYRPVVIVHGIMTGNLSMLPLASTIESAHPGTKVYVPGRFAGWSSLLPLWHQVLSIGSDILNISSSHPEGINLIGYSQGGLIARGILEAFPDHNVKNFISLSAPHGGQYGTEFLRLLFKNLTRSTAYRLFYSRIGQHTSVGNYWRDPYHESLYLEYSNFLPYLNNDKPSPDSLFFKRGITNLSNMFLIGGPDDGVITPWQSSQFGYYDEDLNVVELFDQHTFKRDGLGLKTLKDSGRLKLITLSGVSHFNWHFNETVINEYILPNLD